MHLAIGAFKLHRKRIIISFIIIFAISMLLYYFYPIKLSKRIDLDANNIDSINITTHEFKDTNIIPHTYIISDPDIVKDVCNDIGNAYTINFFLGKPKGANWYWVAIGYKGTTHKATVFTISEGHVSISMFGGNKNFAIPVFSKSSRGTVTSISNIISTQKSKILEVTPK